MNIFVEKYINWLSHDIACMNRGDSGLFTTPFLNPINDCNQVKIAPQKIIVCGFLMMVTHILRFSKNLESISQTAPIKELCWNP